MDHGRGNMNPASLSRGFGGDGRVGRGCRRDGQLGGYLCSQKKQAVGVNLGAKARRWRERNRHAPKRTAGDG